MTKTILSSQFLNEVLNYHKLCNNFDYVVNPSIPIIFFGDLESYSKESLKVLTVGLNPSDTEFRLNKHDKYSLVRFPEYNGDYKSLELTLNNYFKNIPYKRWFNSLEPILNGLGCSFYPNNNLKKVIHTDICSPLATFPTWSKLSKDIKKNLFNRGFLIWKKLISETKPDLIIISTRYEYVKLLNPKKIKTLHTIFKKKDGSPRRPFNLDLFEVNINNHKTLMVYGEPKNTPFGSVTTNDKTKMGEICLNFIKVILKAGS